MSLPGLPSAANVERALIGGFLLVAVLVVGSQCYQSHAAARADGQVMELQRERQDLTTAIRADSVRSALLLEQAVVANARAITARDSARLALARLAARPVRVITRHDTITVDSADASKATVPADGTTVDVAQIERAFRDDSIAIDRWQSAFQGEHLLTVALTADTLNLHRELVSTRAKIPRFGFKTGVGLTVGAVIVLRLAVSSLLGR